MSGFSFVARTLIVSLALGAGVPGAAQTVVEQRQPLLSTLAAPDVPASAPAGETDSAQAPQPSSAPAPVARKHRGIVAAVIIGGLVLFDILAVVSLRHS